MNESSNQGTKPRRLCALLCLKQFLLKECDILLEWYFCCCWNVSEFRYIAEWDNERQGKFCLTTSSPPDPVSCQRMYLRAKTWRELSEGKITGKKCWRWQHLISWEENSWHLPAYGTIQKCHRNDHNHIYLNREMKSDIFTESQSHLSDLTMRSDFVN